MVEKARYCIAELHRFFADVRLAARFFADAASGLFVDFSLAAGLGLAEDLRASEARLTAAFFALFVAVVLDRDFFRAGVPSLEAFARGLDDLAALLRELAGGVFPLNKSHRC